MTNSKSKDSVLSDACIVQSQKTLPLLQEKGGAGKREHKKFSRFSGHTCFTLIELLVVIAIIAILAVLISILLLIF